MSAASDEGPDRWCYDALEIASHVGRRLCLSVDREAPGAPGSVGLVVEPIA